MTETVKLRKDVPLKDRWSIEKIYKNDADWEKDFSTTEGFEKMVSEWPGKLGESPQKLCEIVEGILHTHKKIEKLLVYAHLREDEDLSNHHYTEMFAKIMSRASRLDAAMSFFKPELLHIDANTMNEWLKTDTLAPYKIWLEEILRFRPHTLSNGEEKILAMSREVTGGFHKTYGKLNNVDMPERLPRIENEEGKKVQLTNANFTSLMESTNRNFRKNVFRGYYQEIRGNRNTSAALLDSHVRSQIFFSRAQKHDSAIISSLFNDRMKISVYNSLVSTVHENLGTIHRYYELKKKILGFKDMHIYDLYIPLIHESRRTFSFDESTELTLEAVKPLGSKYVDVLKQGFKDKWVDRYENKGKRSGAYSGGCYETHPYILLNFTGTMNSLFTLTHEAGHSMHSWFSNRTQPYHMASYRILVAEVASITNEMLLVDYLQKNLKDKNERAYLIDHLINDFRGTLIRQTMFAEFEKLIHERIENGKSLTPEYLKTRYYELVKLYHGESFSYDDDDALISYEWARIPHFYYNFYVYKYATGMAAAVDISSRILGGEQGLVEKYLNFLSSGALKPPLELLRDTGVDLMTPEPVKAALSKFSDLVDELTEILDN